MSEIVEMKPENDSINSQEKDKEFPMMIEIATDDEDDLKDNKFSFREEDALIKLSSYSIKEFRLIKNAIEDAIIRKVKNMDNLEKPLETEKSVYYFKNYSVDKIGKAVSQGETGIAEGWNIPIYENEFQNLLGLPFHEDNSIGETLRIKRPRLECFNCLATNHRVQDCPVSIDEERIKLHRKIFATQSMQAQEQAELYSTRYTSDIDSKSNRGFTPGKISEQLRLALGIRHNQLPPYIYLMRELGYPPGWLIEAQVKQQNKLAVHDGDKQEVDKEGPIDATQTNVEIIEYDPDKVISFTGFNEKPGKDFLDESDKFGVERYSEKLSKERFMKTLNLRKKKVIRRVLTKSNLPQSEDSDIEEIESNENLNEIQKSDEPVEEGEVDEKFSSPQKRKKTCEEEALNKHGISVTEILGTPIINNVTPVNSVPNWEKFSENICEHKPYEMESATPIGSYKNIVKLARGFNSKLDSSNSSSQ